MTTNDFKEKLEIFRNIFFSTLSNIDFTDIQDFVYLAEIEILAITNRKIENVIFKPALDKTPRIDGILN